MIDAADEEVVDDRALERATIVDLLDAAWEGRPDTADPGSWQYYAAEAAVRALLLIEQRITELRDHA